MRDLLAPGARNGERPTMTDEPADEPGEPPAIDARLLNDPRLLNRAAWMAAQDRRMSSVAAMMLEATRQMYPLADMLSKLSLRWAALGLSAWLSYYAMSHAHLDWERGAIAAFFLVGSSLIWWKA